MPPTPVPRPRGTPNRSLFTTGAVGSFLAAGAAIPFSLFGLMFGFGFFFFSVFTLLTVGSAVVMSVGIILQRIGLYGFWRNYGSQLGFAAFLYGLIAIAVYLSVLSYLILAPSFALLILGIVGLIMIGVMYILDGAAYIVNRHFVQPGASMAAGVLFIISGGFVCSVLLGFVGGLLAMPALIIGGIVLAGAPIPFTYAPPGDTGPVMPPPPMSP